MRGPHDEDGKDYKGGEDDLGSEKESQSLLSDPGTAEGGHGSQVADGDAPATGAPFLSSGEPQLGRRPMSTTTTARPVRPLLDTAPKAKQPQEAVGWRDLPRRQQLIVITLARLSEPLVQTSLQVCCPFPPSCCR